MLIGLSFCDNFLIILAIVEYNSQKRGYVLSFVCMKESLEKIKCYPFEIGIKADVH